MVKESPATYRITDLASTDRPRERLYTLGSGVLSNSELLAILLRTGLPGENAVQVGLRLLQVFGGLRGLHAASFSEVCGQRGVGPAKAAQIKAALELGYRFQRENPQEKPVIHTPKDVFNLVEFEISGLDHEELWVLDLDTRNHLTATNKIYKGSLNTSMVRVGELFKPAIQHSAASIVLVHNHPSGDPSPSGEDVNLTRTVVQSGKMLDIEVLDHIVIGKGRFVSLKERGLGFS